MITSLSTPIALSIPICLRLLMVLIVMTMKRTTVVMMMLTMRETRLMIAKLWSALPRLLESRSAVVWTFQLPRTWINSFLMKVSEYPGFVLTVI